MRTPMALVRQYLPKGPDLSGYSQEQLDAIDDGINSGPRKEPGVRSPLAVYTSLFLNASQHTPPSFSEHQGLHFSFESAPLPALHLPIRTIALRWPEAAAGKGAAASAPLGARRPARH